MIHLDADETKLLLAAKGHPVKGVHSEAAIGSFDYVQAVCNQRCGMKEGASVFLPYSNLAEKLLSPAQYAILFENLYRRFSNPFIDNPVITPKLLTETLILAIACRKVTDLVLDESLVK